MFLGISGKSQILFAIVYLSRYLDLFTTFISVYNTFMKVVFIGSSLGTLYLMYLKFRATYDHNHDSFRIEFLLLPCFILGLLINHDFAFMEVTHEVIFFYAKIYQWKFLNNFRYCGHFQSIWSLLQSYLNSSLSVKRVKLKGKKAGKITTKSHKHKTHFCLLFFFLTLIALQATICSLWDPIVLCTFSIG